MPLITLNHLKNVHEALPNTLLHSAAVFAKHQTAGSKIKLCSRTQGQTQADLGKLSTPSFCYRQLQSGAIFFQIMLQVSGMLVKQVGCVSQLTGPPPAVGELSSY